jgi:hypothetical protein
MKDECKRMSELILESASGTLPSEKAAELDEHISGCSSCRDYLRAVKADDGLLTEFAHAMRPRVAGLEKNVLEQSNALISAKRPRAALIIRLIRSPRITRVASVVAIIVIIATGLHYYGSSVGRAEVIWTIVAEKVEKAPAFRYLLSLTTQDPRGTIELESVVYSSLKYGLRKDTYKDRKPAVISYIPPHKNVVTRIWPRKKIYWQFRLTDEQVRQMREQVDVRRMVREFTSLRYKQLGYKTIKGVKVEGMEVQDPRFRKGDYESATGRLWADVQTGLPVRTEIEGLAAGGSTQIKHVASDFQWDIELERSVFEPNIPADYTLTAEVDISDVSFDSQSLLHALGMFAELTAGQYPSSLARITAVKEAEEAFLKQFPRDPETPPTAEEIVNSASMQAACMMYTKLVREGKDVAYYGDSVTADFPKAVLMRWNTTAGQYQVILGDLTIETVTAEQLAELEATPLNIRPTAIDPRPADGGMASAVVGLELSWMPGIYAAEHEVYFGADAGELTLLAEVNQPRCDQLQALETGSTYYWRVDEVGSDGSVAVGEVWRFTTGKLQGWWRFDEGAGDVAADSATGKNNGTLSNMEQGSWVEAVSGYGLEFDGIDDFVQTTLKIDQSSSTSITMMAWVYPTGTSLGRRQVVSSDDGWWDWSLLQQGLYWHVFTGDGSWNSASAVEFNQWQHVAAVFKAGEDVVFYKNAVGRSRGFAPVTDSSHNQVAIGNNPGQWDEYFQGVIDDVRIYDYGLSDEEIKAVYQSSRPVGARVGTTEAR